MAPANRSNLAANGEADFVIPITERRLRAVLQEWVTHHNRGRPQAMSALPAAFQHLQSVVELAEGRKQRQKVYCALVRLGES